ncbi:TIGR03643 family protein [Porticoccaceae bacterium]|nr:TIGR03643 family protein [Porticoccaceae bacterium]
MKTHLTESELSRIIEMAWEDRTPFEAIEASFGLSEAEVIKLMRLNMKRRSFKLWRARVSSRKTKHRALRGYTVGSFRCPTQKMR